MANPSAQWFKDAGERVLWTAIEAGAGVGIVYAADLHWAYAPAIAAVLTVVKSIAARYVGDSNSASLRKE
jgi:hypothetical protein